MIGIGTSTPRPEHQRLEHIVGHAGHQEQDGIKDGGNASIGADRPDVCDCGQRDDHGRYLGDAEDENDARNRAGPRHACDQQAQADDNGLDDGHSHHALSDGANCRRGERREFVSTLLSDHACEYSSAAPARPVHRMR